MVAQNREYEENKYNGLLSKVWYAASPGGSGITSWQGGGKVDQFSVIPLVPIS